MSIPPASGLRFLRLAVLVEMVMILALSVLLVVVFALNQDRVDQINQERARNSVAACERASEQNQALIDFMEKLGASSDTLTEAERFFPVATLEECELRARQAINP